MWVYQPLQYALSIDPGSSGELLHYDFLKSHFISVCFFLRTTPCYNKIPLMSAAFITTVLPGDTHLQDALPAT